MQPFLLMFGFGLCAGYVLLRLDRGKRLYSWEKKWLPALGWILMAACFALAAAFLLTAFLL